MRYVTVEILSPFILYGKEYLAGQVCEMPLYLALYAEGGGYLRVTKDESLEKDVKVVKDISEQGITSPVKQPLPEVIEEESAKMALYSPCSEKTIAINRSAWDAYLDNDSLLMPPGGRKVGPCPNKIWDKKFLSFKMVA